MSSNSSELGYKVNEILPGSIYEKWYNSQIRKSEAKEALQLGYLPPQWKSPKYQIYKEKNETLFLAKLKLYFLQEVPFFREVVEDSGTESELVVNAGLFQKKIILNQAVEKCFKPIIDRELLTLDREEIIELEPSLSIMLKSSFTSWRSLKAEFRLLIKKISQLRAQKSSSSIESVKNQVKNRISQVLEKAGIENHELNLKHQNWAIEIEEAKDANQLFQLEYHFIPLFEEINYFLLYQHWFIKLNSQEIIQLKKIEEAEELWKIIQNLIKKKKEQLLIEQINKVIKFYQKLQSFTQQKYNLQVIHLRRVQHILEITKFLFPDSTWKSEKNKLQGNLKIILNELEYFQKIKNLQKSFSKSSSLEKQKHTLQELQENFQNLSKIKSLTKKELQIQTKVRKNLDLILNKDSVNSLASLSPLINSVPQNSPFLLTENRETKLENTSNSDSTPDFQKGLIVLVIVTLVLILIWQWYRKKKEKDPFW